MTDRIIALVDGSIYSRSVCENAAWIATRLSAPVELLHVLGRRETTSSDLSGAIGLGARTEILEELSAVDEARSKLMQRRGRAILDDAEAAVRSAGVASVTARLRIGDLVEAVSAAETGAGLVVIGKRGEAADFAKGHLGSNLERIARASRWPVYVAARAFRPVATVLIAFDGGPSATKAVDHAARSPLFAGLDVRLITVGPETAEARRRLEASEAVLKAGGLESRADIVPGHPGTVIAETLERDGIDLLVMGAYGHSQIRSLVIGSTTTEMVRACRIPVLLFR
ncbi:MAG: universal stress protein [Rhizobiales bacterium]|nr:universal stress protein [Hyphomicrobiales bacterium]